MHQAHKSIRIAATGGFALGLAWGLITSRTVGVVSCIALGAVVVAIAYFGRVGLR